MNIHNYVWMCCGSVKIASLWYFLSLCKRMEKCGLTGLGIFPCNPNQRMKLPLILLLCSLTTASPGDKLKRFKRCVSECDAVNCEGSENLSEWAFEPFNHNLELLLWTCEQDCDYQCQRIITAERKAKDRKVVQFHGKWPFRRIYGIQELVSMVFSIGNLVTHLHGFKTVKNALKTTTNYQGRVQLWVILASSVITMCAWFFSTVFHMRDFLVTERLDYYFAGLTVLSGLFSVTVRYFELFLPQNATKLVSALVVFVSAYTAHVYRLVVDWSYTYNMQANITVGLVQNALMGMLCYRLYLSYYNRAVTSASHVQYVSRILVSSFFNRSDKVFSLYPILLGFIVLLGMSLEVFDFPPVIYDLVDAHSLWHLVTIVPVVYGWYEWCVWDAKENLDSKSMQESASPEIKEKAE